MQKSKIINLIDKLFVSACIFLIIYAWINFYVRSLWTTFVLSTIFSFAIIFVMYYFLDKKEKKKNLSKQYINEKAMYHLAFRLMTTSEKHTLIGRIFAKLYDDTIGNDLTYKQEGKRIITIIATHNERLTQNDLFNILESIDKNFDVCQIICNSHAGVKLRLIKNKTIKLVDQDSLFELFKESNIYPDISELDNSITKFSWKEFFLNIFNKQKSRSYFFAGFVLIFSSIILPYHIYYLIIGSTLLIFALLCKIIPIIKRNHDRF